jgi:hypothetical protein
MHLIAPFLLLLSGATLTHMWILQIDPNAYTDHRNARTILLLLPVRLHQPQFVVRPRPIVTAQAAGSNVFTSISETIGVPCALSLATTVVFADAEDPLSDGLKLVAPVSPLRPHPLMNHLLLSPQPMTQPDLI